MSGGFCTYPMATPAAGGVANPPDNCGDITTHGLQLTESLDTVLGAVFDRNPFMQRGGWYIGLSGMAQTIDLRNRPFSSSG